MSEIQDEKDRRKVYDAMRSAYDYGDTWEQFNAKMDDEGKRKKVFDAMAEAYDMQDSWDTFNAKTSPVVQQTQTETPGAVQQEQQAQQAQQAKSRQQAGHKPAAKPKVVNPEKIVVVDGVKLRYVKNEKGITFNGNDYAQWCAKVGVPMGKVYPSVNGQKSVQAPAYVQAAMSNPYVDPKIFQRWGETNATHSTYSSTDRKKGEDAWAAGINATMKAAAAKEARYSERGKQATAAATKKAKQFDAVRTLKGLDAQDEMEYVYDPESNSMVQQSTRGITDIDLVSPDENGGNITTQAVTDREGNIVTYSPGQENEARAMLTENFDAQQRARMAEREAREKAQQTYYDHEPTKDEYPGDFAGYKRAMEAYYAQQMAKFDQQIEHLRKAKGLGQGGGITMEIGGMLYNDNEGNINDEISKLKEQKEALQMELYQRHPDVMSTSVWSNIVHNAMKPIVAVARIKADVASAVAPGSKYAEKKREKVESYDNKEIQLYPGSANEWVDRAFAYGGMAAAGVATATGLEVPAGIIFGADMFRMVSGGAAEQGKQARERGASDGQVLMAEGLNALYWTVATHILGKTVGVFGKRMFQEVGMSADEQLAMAIREELAKGGANAEKLRAYLNSGKMEDAIARQFAGMDANVIKQIVAQATLGTASTSATMGVGTLLSGLIPFIDGEDIDKSSELKRVFDETEHAMIDGAIMGIFFSGCGNWRQLRAAQSRPDVQPLPGCDDAGREYFSQTRDGHLVHIIGEGSKKGYAMVQLGNGSYAEIPLANMSTPYGITKEKFHGDVQRLLSKDLETAKKDGEKLTTPDERALARMGLQDAQVELIKAIKGFTPEERDAFDRGDFDSDVYSDEHKNTIHAYRRAQNVYDGMFRAAEAYRDQKLREFNERTGKVVYKDGNWKPGDPISDDSQLIRATYKKGVDEPREVYIVSGYSTEPGAVVQVYDIKTGETMPVVNSDLSGISMQRFGDVKGQKYAQLQAEMENEMAGYVDAHLKEGAEAFPVIIDGIQQKIKYIGMTVDDMGRNVVRFVDEKGKERRTTREEIQRLYSQALYERKEAYRYGEQMEDLAIVESANKPEKMSGADGTEIVPAEPARTEQEAEGSGTAVEGAVAGGEGVEPGSNAPATVAEGSSAPAADLEMKPYEPGRSFSFERGGKTWTMTIKAVDDVKGTITAELTDGKGSTTKEMPIDTFVKNFSQEAIEAERQRIAEAQRLAAEGAEGMETGANAPGTVADGAAEGAGDGAANGAVEAAVEEIPVVTDEKGRARKQYHLVSEERTLDDIASMDGYAGRAEMQKKFVAKKLEQVSNELDEHDAKKPSEEAYDDPEDYSQDLSEWKTQRDEINQRKNYWESVKAKQDQLIMESLRVSGADLKNTTGTEHASVVKRLMLQLSQLSDENLMDYARNFNNASKRLGGDATIDEMVGIYRAIAEQRGILAELNEHLDSKYSHSEMNAAREIVGKIGEVTPDSVLDAAHDLAGKVSADHVEELIDAELAKAGKPAADWEAVNKLVEERRAAARQAAAEAEAKRKAEKERREAKLRAERAEYGEPQSAAEFVAINLPKLDPEDVRKQTGYGKEEQKRYGMIFAKPENGGVGVERAAEILAATPGAENWFPMDASTEALDTAAIRDTIIDFLSHGKHPKTFVKESREAMWKEQIDEAREGSYENAMEEDLGRLQQTYLKELKNYNSKVASLPGYERTRTGMEQQAALEGMERAIKERGGTLPDANMVKAGAKKTDYSKLGDVDLYAEHKRLRDEYEQKKIDFNWLRSKAGRKLAKELEAIEAEIDKRNAANKAPFSTREGGEDAEGAVENSEKPNVEADEGAIDSAEVPAEVKVDLGEPDIDGHYDVRSEAEKAMTPDELQTRKGELEKTMKELEAARDEAWKDGFLSEEEVQEAEDAYIMAKHDYEAFCVRNKLYDIGLHTNGNMIDMTDGERKYWDSFAKDQGVPVIVTDMLRPDESGKSRANSMYVGNEGAIWVAADAVGNRMNQVTMAFAVGHENTHKVKDWANRNGSADWDLLVQSVKDEMGMMFDVEMAMEYDKNYQRQVEEFMERPETAKAISDGKLTRSQAMKLAADYANKKVDDAYITEEVVANHIGNRFKVVAGKDFAEARKEMLATSEQTAEIWNRMANELEEGSVPDEAAEKGASFSIVRDPELIERLNGEKTVEVYHAMQLVEMPDGKMYLFPPMAKKHGNKVVEGIPVDADGKITPKWEQADENPDLAFRMTAGEHAKKIPNDAELEISEDGYAYYNGTRVRGDINEETGEFEPSWYFTLKKDNKGASGKKLGDLNAVAYDPYQHSGFNAVNDQFTTAYDRPHLVIVKCKVPESEISGESGYRADKAKLGVGTHEWKGGKLQTTEPRKVALSRWDMPFEIVSDAEVAQAFKDVLDANGLTEVPFNIVTPAQREELVRLGVKIGEPSADNGGQGAREAYEAWKSEQPSYDFKTKITLGGEEFDVKELEDTLKTDVTNKLEEMDFDVTVDKVKLIGSRLKGTEHESSDLDLLVEYSGSDHEDTLFNALNETPIEINGVTVDVNPITRYKSGTIEKYLERNKDYSKSDDELFSVRKEKIGDKTLYGAHNISEEKLRKALRLGGLANPSTAVADINVQPHTAYANISLIMPSSLVDAKTGKNIGTFDRDAWTPLYPKVEYFTNKTSRMNEQKLLSVVENEELRRMIDMQMSYYRDGNSNTSGLGYVYLKQKGIDIPMQYKENPYAETLETIEKQFEGGRPDFDAYRAMPREQRDLVTALILGERSKKNIQYYFDCRDGKAGTPKVQEFFQRMFEDGIDFRTFDSTIYRMQRARREAGEVDLDAVQRKASEYIRDNNLEDDFREWQSKTYDEMGYDEKFQVGFKADGTRIYKKNTVENASAYMKKQGRNASGDHWSTGAGMLLARMSNKYRTLKQIREQKGRLSKYGEGDGSFNKDGVQKRIYDAARYFQGELPVEQYDQAWSFLEDAIVEGKSYDTIEREYNEYFKRYGADLHLTDEQRQELDAIRKDAHNVRPHYFETKFERPVKIEEFVAAVIPDNTGSDVKQALRDKGLDVIEYDHNDNDGYQNAIKQAADRDDVMFSTRRVPEKDRVKWGDISPSEVRYFLETIEVTGQAPNNITMKEWPMFRYRLTGLANAALIEDKGIINGLANTIPVSEKSRKDVVEGWDSMRANWKASEKAEAMLDKLKGYIDAVRPWATVNVQRDMDNMIRDYEHDIDMLKKLANGEDALKDDDFRKFSTRVANSDPFYSNAAKSVEAVKQEKATADQWLAMLKKNGGLKAEEDKWMRLSEWLETEKARAAMGMRDKAITKQEIEEYIAQNSVKVEERTYSEHGINDIKLTPAEEAECNAKAIEQVKSKEFKNVPIELQFDDNGKLLLESPEDIESLGTYFAKVFNESITKKNTVEHWANVAKDNIEMWYGIHKRKAEEQLKSKKHHGVINDTRLDYTTRGLKNNREIALTVPTIEPYNATDEIHFVDAGGGRAVAWSRFGETTDADGNRVLVIDEIQSKRHQDGRERGYESDYSESPRGKFQAAAREMREFRSELAAKYGDNFLFDDLTAEEQAKHQELLNNMQELSNYDSNESLSYDVPDAPFQKNWHEIAMKRMLRLAAEEGYDKVAWTTGQQQAERYGLAKTLKSAELLYVSDNGVRSYDVVTKANGTFRVMADKDGIIKENHLSSTLNGHKMSDVFGTEIADKMSLLDFNDENEGVIDFDEVTVGGEGMKAFYDKMLPNFMNKYGKKWGVKVGEVELPDVEEAGRKMWSIDVTPEMKESVMGGQPLFSIRHTPEEFEKLKALAKENHGYIMPGVAEATVNIVNVEPHTFGGTLKEARKEAKAWAKEQYQGNTFGFPGGGEYVITGKAIDKYLEQKSIENSDSPNVHLSVLTKLPEIISNSIDVEVHQDFGKIDGTRSEENGVVNENRLIHRVYGAVEIEGKQYRVKTTMYEYKADADGQNSPHSYEITKIELLDAPQKSRVENAAQLPSGRSNNSITGAKLLQNVEKSYDPGKKIIENAEKNADFGEKFSVAGLRGMENLDKTRGTSTMLSLNSALDMEKAIGRDKMTDEDRRKIKLATGWERDTNGQWKHELPDLWINRDAFEKLVNSAELPEKITLSDIANADELFDAYPRIKSMRVNIDKTDKVLNAFYDPQRDDITISAKALKAFGDDSVMRDRNIDSLEDMLIHEVQHAIQERESFAKGGNLHSRQMAIDSIMGNLTMIEDEARRWYMSLPDDMAQDVRDNTENLSDELELMSMYLDEEEPLPESTMNDIREELTRARELRSMSDIEYYRRLGGEVESRNVEFRNGMSTVEKQNSLLSDTADVPAEQIEYEFSNYNGKRLSIEDMEEERQRLRAQRERGFADANDKAIERKRAAQATAEALSKRNGVEVTAENGESPEEVTTGWLLKSLDQSNLKEMLGSSYDHFLGDLDAEEIVSKLGKDAAFKDVDAKWWKNVKENLTSALLKAGIDLPFELSDADARYILWKNAKKGNGDILSKAAEIDMRRRLGIGEFTSENTRTSQRMSADYRAIQEHASDTGAAVVRALAGTDFGPEVKFSSVHPFDEIPSFDEPVPPRLQPGESVHSESYKERLAAYGVAHEEWLTRDRGGRGIVLSDADLFDAVMTGDTSKIDEAKADENWQLEQLYKDSEHLIKVSQRQMKRAIFGSIIERRKAIETANFDDAVFIHDIIDRTTKEQRKAIPFILEGETVEGVEMTPELQKVVEDIRSWFDEQHARMEEEGLFSKDEKNHYLKNYVTHIWDRERSDKKGLAILENRMRLRAPYTEHRVVKSLKEGIELGLVPKHEEITGIMAEYGNYLNEVIANRHLLHDLEGYEVTETLEDGSETPGKTLLKDADAADREYVIIDSNALRGKAVWAPLAPMMHVIFGHERAEGIKEGFRKAAHVYDVAGGLMKKINLALSFFHHAALTETAVGAMNPYGALKTVFKNIIWDAALNRQNGEFKPHSPAFNNPELTRDAVEHLVQLGATNDYAAKDVQALTEKLLKFVEEHNAEGAIGKINPAIPIAKIIDFVNKGMDTVLWDYLHDGLKLYTYEKMSKEIRSKAAKQGLDESTVNKLLDEAGQFINDTYGGQHWDVLGYSPKTVKWMRRFLLSPDWTLSTLRQALAPFGFGQLYEDRTLWERFVKESPEYKEITNPSDEQVNSMIRKARAKHGAAFWAWAMATFIAGYNALNAYNRKKDVDEQQEIAEQQRRMGETDYKSPYELAYPDGMKWYDYTFLGNTQGNQTLLFMGRMSNGIERYARWGKQFREMPELFYGKEGLSIPFAAASKLAGKLNPVINTVFNVAFGNSVNGWDNDLMKDKEGFERTWAATQVLLKSFTPYSLPDDKDMEFIWTDLFMPSKKGFTWYKAKKGFVTAIKAGDKDLVKKIYQACVLNGFDPEEIMNTAFSEVKQTARKSLTGIDRNTPVEDVKATYDNSQSIDEKRRILTFIDETILAENYKQVTLDEVVERASANMQGRVYAEKNDDEYILHSKYEDVAEDDRLKSIRKNLEEYNKQYKELTKSDPKAAREYAKKYKKEINAYKEVNKAIEEVNKIKKEMHEKGYSDNNMDKIRRTRKKFLDKSK